MTRRLQDLRGLVLPAVLGFAVVCSTARADWEVVGSAGFSAGVSQYMSLAFYNGEPYVAYMDGGNGNKATVMRYTGGSWQTVGAAGFSADTAFYTSLAFYNGEPYVAYRDVGNGNKATVMRYTGGSWQTVGAAGFSAGSSGYTSLAFYNGEPYVAYRDDGNGSKATVMRYTGGSWQTVGAAGFSAGGTEYTSLAFYNGEPYVAYRDAGNGSKATVMRYTGGSWQTVGSAGFSADVVFFTSLAFYNGEPYVAYRDCGNGDKATVMRYTGGSWQTVGAAGFTANVANDESLAFYNGEPYLAYRDLGGTDKAIVMRYTGGSWQTVGTAGFSAGSVEYTSLAFYNGEPYVAYLDSANGDKATVMKYTAGSTPTTQATNVNFSSVGATQATVGWTRGNGSACAAFMKAASTGSAAPVDDTTYTANTAFGTGTQIGATGWYCVYKGTGTSVATTGLSAGTTYRVMVCEYNGGAGSEKYFTDAATGNPANVTTDTAPTVTTTAASNVTGTTADSGGNVTSDGGDAVTARGVCWGTAANPTTAGDKTTDGTGTGAFTSNITGLAPVTTYHVRAYATNSVGTAYGGDESFTTGVTVPTATTAAVSNIEMTSAVCGGTITADGGDTVTARGVCWNTSGTPASTDNKTSDGTGTGTFTSSITGLSSGMTYYLRAYATNSAGTGYGNEVSLTTSTGGGGDGTVDECPYDPDKTSPGVCGCGVPDTDTDGDGTPDCHDDDPKDSGEDEPGTDSGEEPDAGTDGTDDASTNGDAEDADTNGNDGDGEDTDADEEAGDGIDVGTDGDADTDGTADGDAAPAEATVSADGTASLTHNGVSATVGGVDAGDSVVLKTDDDGVTTLTVTNADGEEVVKVVAEGLGEGAAINVSIGESGEPVVTMTDAAGRTLTINTLHYPAGVQIRGGRDDQGHTVLSIVDESGTTRTLVMEAVGADGDILITVTYNAPGQEAGQSVPSDGSAEMTGDEQAADLDSVTIEAAGSLGPEGVTIILAYDIADTAGEDESALRLHRLSNDGSQYLPAGTNDVGDEPPTYTLGDYGVDTASKTVWAQTDELGTFAVLPTDEDDTEATASRQQAPVCGVFGIVPLAGLLLAMGVWTLARHRSPTNP